MSAKGPCPKCRGQFVELERSGIKIDACRECRGVFLDRGELDGLIAAEQREVAAAYDDDEAFFREMTGQASAPAPQAPAPAAQRVETTPPPRHHHQQYGIDVKTAERIFSDFRSHQSAHKKKKQKGLLEQLFD
jgi:Zn-finger nucleic acid-binding protein